MVFETDDFCCLKLAFHDADTDTDFLARIPADSLTHRHIRENPCEDVGEDVGVVKYGVISSPTSQQGSWRGSRVSVSVSASWNASLTANSVMSSEDFDCHM